VTYSREPSFGVALAERRRARLSIGGPLAFAFGVLVRRWGQLLRVAWVPLLLAAGVLYASLDGYLSELQTFGGAPDPRVAGIALGELAAGIFGSLVLFSMFAVSVTEIALGREASARSFGLRLRRQEWRLYAAYLKFSVGVIAFFALLCGAAIGNLRVVPAWLLVPVGVLGAYLLFVRTAFLFPPLIMSERGPMLRRAWALTASDAWRIAVVVLLLLLPGVAIEIAIEFALRLGGMAIAGHAFPSLATYAPETRRVLPGFLVAMTLWSFVTITLLTGGAVAVYRSLVGESARLSR
jgi:hypothetical protein